MHVCTCMGVYKKCVTVASVIEAFYCYHYGMLQVVHASLMLPQCTHNFHFIFLQLFGSQYFLVIDLHNS